MTVGVDFGKRSLKVVELAVDEEKKYLWRSGGSELNNVNWFSRDKTEVEEAKKYLAALWKKYKLSTTNINTSLRESDVYSRMFQMPPLSDVELNQALRFELEQYLPLPIEQVYYSFNRLEKVKKDKSVKELIYVVATPKKKVDEMLALSVDYDLIIDVLENSLGAIARSVSYNVKEPLLVADLGYSQFSIAIVKNGQVYVSHNLDLSGQGLNKLLARTLNVDEDQADKVKRSYGLDKKQLNGKLAEILIMALDQLVDESKRLIAFFGDKVLPEKVSGMVICGGEATLPGLSVYLSQKMNLEISLPNFSGFIKGIPEEVEKEPHLFAQAIGSAMRDDF